MFGTTVVKVYVNMQVKKAMSTNGWHIYDANMDIVESDYYIG